MKLFEWFVLQHKIMMMGSRGEPEGAGRSTFIGQMDLMVKAS